MAWSGVCSLKSFFGNHFQSFFISPISITTRCQLRSIRDLNTYNDIRIVSSCPQHLSSLWSFETLRLSLLPLETGGLSFSLPPFYSFLDCPFLKLPSNTLIQILQSCANKKDIKSWPILSRRDTSKPWTESTNNTRKSLQRRRPESATHRK